MVNNYQNNVNFSIDLENIENYLNKIVELISTPSKKVINKIIDKTKSSNEPSHDGYLNEINVKINNLYHNMDEIVILLKNNNFFNDEYFDFCEIQDMIKDTLNRDLIKITNDDLAFVIDLIRNFSDLVGYKIMLAENTNFNNKDYKLKHQSYFSNLNELKSYYYDNIYGGIVDEDLFLTFSQIIMG